MTREQAINNMIMCGNYLATYIADGYISFDITPHETSLHLFAPSRTEKDMRAIADELGNLRLSASDLKFIQNEKLDQLTFTIYWHF